MAVIHINKGNFEQEVLRAEQPVLLDFWAEWCGPCRMLSPVIEQLGDELTDVKVGKVNVDENQELAMQFGVMSIPMLVVMKDGKVADSRVGVQPKAAILAMLGK